MTKSFPSKNIKPNGYTKTLSLSAIHIYIYIYQYANPVRRPFDNTILYGTVTLYRERL